MMSPPIAAASQRAPYSGAVPYTPRKTNKKNVPCGILSIWIAQEHPALLHVRVYIITTYFSRVKDPFLLEEDVEFIYEGIPISTYEPHHASSPSGMI